MTLDENVLKEQIEKAQQELVNKLVEGQIKELLKDKSFLNKAIKSLAEQKARDQIDNAITQTLNNLNLQSSIDNKLGMLHSKVYDMVTSAVNTTIRESIGISIANLVKPMVVDYIKNNPVSVSVKFVEVETDDYYR